MSVFVCLRGWMYVCIVNPCLCVIPKEHRYVLGNVVATRVNFYSQLQSFAPLPLLPALQLTLLIPKGTVSTAYIQIMSGWRYKLISARILINF